MFNMNNMMKQAQKLQERMNKVQEEIAASEVVGESGAGLVKVTMNGIHEVRRVELDDSIWGDDKEMCEDLIAAAINDAKRKVDSLSQEKMKAVTAGLPIPPGMKLPF